MARNTNTTLMLSIFFGILFSYSCTQKLPPEIREAERYFGDKKTQYELKVENMCNYYKYTPDQRTHIVDSVSIYGGDNIQCLRLACWIMEDNPKLREKLMWQWLSVHRSNNALVPQDELSRILIQCTQSEPAEQNRIRMEEFREVYSICAGQENKKQYFTDLSADTKAYIIRPLIKMDEPMRMAIFSSDTSTILTALTQTNELNMQYWDKEKTGGTVKSRTVHEALCKITQSILVQNKKTQDIYND